MQFFAVAALFAGALAVPTSNTGSGPVCPVGLFSVPQCCATDVLGVADLDCTAPVNGISDPRNFKDECARYGKQARCCVLPALGLGVLCTAPAGQN
ncbi:Cell wall protein qid3 [Cladobotryum mycophilum]|uniref:Cell wall protein qid3 n=1 Tax=Cladobotryum mycophilum TaxID=491253 RepID=A0ABR0SIE3_9HYPO